MTREMPRSMPRTSGSYQLACGVEGVAEAVAAVGLVAVVGFEGALDAEAGFGEEGERAGGGVGDDGAVDGAEAFAFGVGAAPGGVAVLCSRRR